MERRKFYTVICIATLAILLISNFCFAKYSGGDGEPNNPYQIASIYDWNDLMTTSADWDKYFILVNDISFNGDSLTPIGNSTTNFSGTFNGNNHVIRKTIIYQPNGENVGLFGITSQDSNLVNIKIEDANVTGDFFVGRLAGYNYGVITNCYATGKTYGYRAAGGLVGCNEGIIDNSHSKGVVDGNIHVGGLAGENFYGKITNSYSISRVIGTEFDGGGLVGRCYASEIYNCYSNGFVYGLYMAGGLVGYQQDGVIANCFSTADVISEDSAGGLVGHNEYYISNCYSTGTVYGVLCAGGLAGSNGYNGQITKCYSTGAVFGEDVIGGLCGWNNYGGLITLSFWDVDTSCLTSSAGGVGYNTYKMKKEDTYSLNAWYGSDWTIDDGKDYPYLVWENAAGEPMEADIPLNGEGTAAVPYEIRTADDLKLLNSACVLWDKHFKLMNDIDVSGYEIEPIGSEIRPVDDESCIPYFELDSQFRGVFDGDGHVVSNLNIDDNSTDYAGFFKYTGSTAIIKNLGLTDVNINGRNYVGALAGINSGQILNCYSTGEIKGNEKIGGLAGWNAYGSYITSCYVTGIVKGLSDVGGLLGCNYHGKVTDCYFTGEVQSETRAGGLAAANFGSITNCSSHAVTNGNTAGGLVGDNKPDSEIAKSFSVGDVNGSTTGGLVGSNGGNIIQSYSSANVVSTGWAGGLVGGNDSYTEYSCMPSGSGVIIIWIGPYPPGGSIINSYSTGSVIGNSKIFGLCGENCYGIVEKCYSSSPVSPQEEYPTGVQCGCILYESMFEYDANSYFLEGVIPDNGYGIPLTDIQMKEQSSFVNWDFSYTDGNEAVWFMAEDGYPILTWQISDADIYTDGKNNFKDFTVFANYWMREDCTIYNYYCEFADMDFDHDVDVDDLAELMSYWLEEEIYQ